LSRPNATVLARLQAVASNGVLEGLSSLLIGPLTPLRKRDSSVKSNFLSVQSQYAGAAMNNNNGWIKLHRRLLDNPRIKDPDWLAVWIHVLLKATHQPFKANFDGKIVELKPGQFITGRHAIAAETGVSSAKVWRILETMKTEQQIEQQPGVKGSIFTVKNWNTYQNCEQQSEQPLSSDRATTEQQLSTNKNVKNTSTQEHEKGKPLRREAWQIEKDIKRIEDALSDINQRAGCFSSQDVLPRLQKRASEGDEAAKKDADDWQRLTERLAALKSEWKAAL